MWAARLAAALSRVTQEEADRTLDVLLEYGVNHIDTAASYGDAELRIGPWMKEHRQDFFLATKTGKRTYQEAWDEWEALESQLDRLVATAAQGLAAGDEGRLAALVADHAESRGHWKASGWRVAGAGEDEPKPAEGLPGQSKLDLPESGGHLVVDRARIQHGRFRHPGSIVRRPRNPGIVHSDVGLQGIHNGEDCDDGKNPNGDPQQRKHRTEAVYRNCLNCHMQAFPDQPNNAH